MARLIPSYLEDNTPPGERDVFNMLAKGPDNWVVLHSLDLAPWNRGLRTEIDFVVIVPDCGILCIEVKSHLNITFDGNVWSPSEIKRSPFKQASDGRFTFYRHLSKLASQFRNIPVVHLCIFPNASFNLRPNLSVAPFELMDNRIFRSFKNASDFCNDIKMRIWQSIDADGNLTRLPKALSTSQVEDIAGYCVPVKKCSPDSRDEIRRREQEIDQILRDQQKPILKLAAANDRIIVSGGAGTGKTLISMELARRRAELGERVALLCFNQLVGEWMKEKMALIKPELPNLVVGRCIQIMAQLTNLNIPEKPDNSYWDVTLPYELEKKLTDPDLRAIAPFDYLVLDEAQDILTRPNIWECVLQFINGGLERGKYALFGDFEHQVLGERELLSQTWEKVLREAQPAKWKLSENCRNYSIVGATAIRLSGFEDEVYSGYMRQGGSIANYNIHFYNTEDEQANLLSIALKDFKHQGYWPEEITILSFESAENSIVTSPILKGYNLHPAWQKGRCTHYCTVHAYKGLENKVIFLTDVSANEAEYRRDLFYTGMTRATESVRVFCNNNFRDTLLKWLMKGEVSHA
jgi:hypothetical protein